MMSGDFQNEQKFIYVLPTHPLFRQYSFSFSSCTISNKYATSFLQNFEFTNVLPT